MRKNFIQYHFLSCGMIMYFMPHVLADPTPVKPTLTPSAARALAVAGIRRFNSSMNAPWTDNDRYFAQERTEIDTAIQDGEKPVDLLKKYEPDANRFPDAPTVQFRYYYAAYKDAVDINNQSQDAEQQAELRLGDLYGLALKVELPHTYNYARLRFLCALYSDPFDNYPLKSLGIRLVVKDPSDFSVKFALTSLLVDSHDPHDSSTALKYCLEMAQKNPSNPRVFGMLGYAYYVQWHKTHNKSDAENAIAGYQKSLDLAPANSYFRPIAQRVIDQLRSEEAN